MTQALLRRRALLGFITTAPFALSACGEGGDDPPAAVPKAVWALAPSDLLADYTVFGLPRSTGTTLTNQTVRQLAKINVGGDSFRLRLSNALGASDVRIDKTTIAMSNSTFVGQGNSSGVLFGGSTSVTVPAGQEVWSDQIGFKAAADATVAIDFFFGDRTYITSGRLFQTVSIAAGDQAGARTLSGATEGSSSLLLSEIDVYSTAVAKVVVAFGDSITEGQRVSKYPVELQKRLSGTAEAGTVSVVNQGIGGNRLLRPRLNPSAVSRFDRDVLKVSGATHMIMLLGINDIQNDATWPGDKAGADEIVSAMASLVHQARQANIKAFVGTLLPWQGSPYYSEEREGVRQTVNSWIRSSANSADAVLDFERALQDPANQSALLPGYDSGDHIHPSAAGYQRMAAAIDLALF